MTSSSLLPEERRPFLWLAISLPAVILLAAWATPLLTPWVESIGLVEARPDDPDRAFLKVFRRLLLIPLVILFLALVRPWREVAPEDLGLRGKHARWRPPLLAYGITLVLGALLVWLQFASGRIDFESPVVASKALLRVGRWLAVGLLVATLEEWFFRGWLTRRLAGRWPYVRAVVVSAVLYAIAHAFRPSALRFEVSQDFGGALEALFGWIGGIVDPEIGLPRLFGLFLMGIVLQGLFRRTKTLWTSIAAHAAGILVIHGHSGFTDGPNVRTWAGGQVVVDGWPAWALLAVLALILWWPRKTGAGTTSWNNPSP